MLAKAGVGSGVDCKGAWECLEWVCLWGASERVSWRPLWVQETSNPELNGSGKKKVRWIPASIFVFFLIFCCALGNTHRVLKFTVTTFANSQLLTNQLLLHIVPHQPFKFTSLYWNAEKKKHNMGILVLRIFQNSIISEHLSCFCLCMLCITCYEHGRTRKHRSDPWLRLFV